MKKTKLFMMVLIIGTVIISCKKNSDDGDDNSPITTPVAAKNFSNVSFDKDHMFFSTLGSSITTLDSNQAKLVASTIDLAYTWDGAYDAAGFLDPVTRSSDAYYWSSQFQTSWTNVSHQVIWYTTNIINYSDHGFTNAKNDQSLIAQYFADTSKVKIVPANGVWPAGTYIGGRNGTAFGGDMTFAFKRVSDGKRGLLQLVSTPTPGLNSITIVNIIVEN